MTNLNRCYNIFDLREVARRRLPKGIFEYVDKGTEDGISLEENRAAFQRIKLRTRFFLGVGPRQVRAAIRFSAQNRVFSGLRASISARKTLF